MSEVRVTESIGNPFSRLGDPIPFYRILVPVVIAVLTAFAMMFCVSKIPARDLVEDVGLSLMLGYENYSESAEQRAFLAFVIASLLVGWVAGLCLSRCSRERIETLGNWSSWFVLISLLGVCPYFLAISQVIVLGICLIGAACVGRVVGESPLSRPELAVPVWITAIVIWAGLHDHGTYLVLNVSPEMFIAMASIAVSIAIIQLCSPTWFSRLWPWITAVTYLALLVGNVSRRNVFAVCVILATSIVCFCATSLEHRRPWRMAIDWWQVRFQRIKHRRWWLCLVGVILWMELGYLTRKALLDESDLLLLSLQGAAMGLVLFAGRHQLPTIAWRIHWPTVVSWAELPWALPITLFVVSAIRGWDGLWFGVCLMIVSIALIQVGGWRLHPTTLTGLFLAGMLALACLPDLDQMYGSDSFHEGCNLSAIWEFEQGEPLYSRVFPLRATKFFLGWLSRKFVSQSIEGTNVFESFSNCATIAGACLAAYAWRRSPLWAVVVGLLVQPGGEMLAANLTRSPFWIAATGLQVDSYGDAREGVMLLIVGLACEIFRRGGAVFVPLVVMGVVTCFCGFDMMVPFLGGVAVAMFCGELARGHSIKQFLRGCVLSVGFVGTVAALFTGLVIRFQGLESASAFWRIFLDYCRHFSSFCGTPLDIRPQIIIELIGLAAFAARGTVLWHRMTRRRFQMWAFLLVISSLFWFRALGRSDHGHVTGPLHLLHLLWALIFTDVILLFARSQLGFSRRDPQLIGGAALVILAFGAGGTSNPWRLFHQLGQIATAECVAYPADPHLDQLVRSDEYLFAADFSMANYAQRRHNPTRHALAICISSPNEQRAVVSDLTLRPPAVVVWYWPSIDEVHGLTRHYILANYLLHHFRPEDNRHQPSIPYAVPSESDWTGLDQVPSEYAPVQQLRRLPLIWGQHRWPGIESRIVGRRPMELQRTFEDDPYEVGDWSRYRLEQDLIPKDFNYLLVQFAVDPSTEITTAQFVDPKWSVARLQFSSGNEFEPHAQTTWDCPTDGQRHVYLVPIGCHPAWTWRTAIRQLRLRINNGVLLPGETFEAISIDDLRED